jgi:tRNA-dihydrouridine synthase
MDLCQVAEITVRTQNNIAQKEPTDAARLSVAPMIDWSDRHFRHFIKLINPELVTYSEMIVDKALIHGDVHHLLARSPIDSACVLQLGGSEAAEISEAVAIAENYGKDHDGYIGYNINVGCPSDRVQSGCFGAVLMHEPERVAAMFKAMVEKTDKPISIKCRLGVDDQNVDDTLPKFLEVMLKAGCRHVIVHARKAWLQGLSPKENRDIPPLNYDLPAIIKKHWGNEIRMEINGGITSLDQARGMLHRFDGVMIGRAAYANPFMFAPQTRTREEVLMQMRSYIDHHVAQGGRAHQILRHMAGLYHNIAGARSWRQLISESSIHDHNNLLDGFLSRMAA